MINFHTDVNDVFENYLALIDRTYNGLNRAQLGNWDSAADGDSFHFVSAETMRGYITKGYTVPGIEAPRGAKTHLRRKMVWSEEGDLDVDSALNGADYPFRSFTPRKRLPGLRIDVEVGFRAAVSTDTLEAYARFVSQLVYGLEDRGYKMDVNVVSRAQIGGQQVNVFVKCQTAGKRTDFKAWSALLSPGGHRHLIFATRGLAGDRNGVNFGGSVGGSTFKGWRVEFDRKTRAITIGCNSGGSPFPAEMMDRQLTEVLAQL